MRYRPELELVLKDVCLNIQGGQRVGVCGRTGAGKSSLTLAIFRILEAASGRILIDGVDVAHIGLHDLRSIVSIIPQDPQLFEGTLRNNVDPTNVSSDADIWLALEQSYLKDHVNNNMGGSLDAEISEGGSNLSSGQRQLVCFARALLRKTKILVLDEATSSIDLETDEAVQQILRGPDFKGVTTLTIAHRINTIMDSDRVLVMSDGKVAEYDTPEVLMQTEGSVFKSLVDEAGLGKKGE
jgi:ABC-type multidrug transport system fused ATPase/permease subunit